MQKWAVPSYVPWYDEDAEFRIKPQPKEDKWLYVYEDNDGTAIFTFDHRSYCVGRIKLEDVE